MNKKKLPLFLGLAILTVLFLFACAGAPEEKPQTEEKPAKPMEEKEPEYREVKEEIQLVEKMSSYYPDGVLDQYRLYSYEEGGTKLLKEELFNSEDELQERIEYSYEGELCTKESTYTSEGELLRYHEYSYNDEGLLIEDRLFNAEDALQSLSKYEYDEEGRKSKWSIYDGNEALLAYTEYIYEGGRNTMIQNYRPGGELEDSFILEYDQRGRKVKETWYNASGDIEEYRSYRYADDYLVEEIVYRGNDSVKRKIIYTNNEAGNPVDLVYMDGGENVQEKISYEYIERIRTKMVPVE